jgi:hypothetical protein
MKIFSLGTAFPEPAKDVAKWIYYKLLWSRHERNFVCINSIPKSGTNYCKALLANYFSIVYSRATAKVSHDEVKQLFPNYRAAYIQGTSSYRPPSSLMRATPYDDIVHGHSTRMVQFFSGKIVFLYRNPLDVIVSRYYYSFKYRKEQSSAAEHPRDVMRPILQEYIEHYAFMKEHCRRRHNAIMISYEDMMEFPLSTFHILLNWLNIPIEQKALQTALAFSSFAAAREEEKNGGTIAKTKDFTGLFTRSGKIGQWKQYFNDEDLKNIRETLAAAAINLESFVIEPRVGGGHETVG